MSDSSNAESNDLSNVPSVTGHKGRHSAVDVKEQLQDVDEEKVHKIEPDQQVMLEQVSEHKYDTVAAMIREYIQNANATVIEAKDFVGDDYSPLIYVGYYPHEQQLVIMDNGMGWSREKLDEVGCKPGKSTNTYNPERPGTFGIGRLSAFKGVGGDGGFFMHTRSRRTDECIKGMWTADAFVEQEMLDDKLEENQYGTVFTFPLKYINVDVQEAVEEFAQSLRNPVLFVQYDETGSPQTKEEYGGTFFTENASEEKCVIYEDEYVRAVSGNEGEQKDGTPNHGFATDNGKNAVLLDVPINLNNDIITDDLPFKNTKLLVKKEQQFIVDGPNKGKVQVKQGEYNDIPADEKHKYIKQENTNESDIPLLTPTGDRDRFQKNPRFMEWLHGQLLSVYIYRMVNVLEELIVSDNIIREVDYDELGFFMSNMDRVKYRHDAATGKIHGMKLEIKQLIERSEPDPRIDDDTIEVLENADDEFYNQIKYLLKKIEYCKRGSGAIVRRSGRTKMKHWEFFRMIDDDTTVFMCVRPVMKKAKAIWQDSEKNELVRVKKSELYESYEERHGWKRLSWVDNETIDQLDISDELKNRIRTDKNQYTNANAGLDAPNRELTIHTFSTTQDKYNNQTWKTQQHKELAQNILESLESDNEAIEYNVKRLVLFPSNCDKNISDYYKWYPKNDFGMASCAVKTFEYLNQSDSVMHIHELIEQAEDIRIHTENGKETFDEFRFSDEFIEENMKKEDGNDELKNNVSHVIHVVNDNVYNVFTSENAFSLVKSRVLDKCLSSYQTQFDDDTTLKYGIIKRSDVDLLRLSMSDFLDVSVQYSEPHPITFLCNEGDMVSPDVGVVAKSVFDSDTEPYVYARIPDWKGTDEFRTLTRIDSNLSMGAKEVVDSVAESRYDKGLEPLSETNE